MCLIFDIQNTKTSHLPSVVSTSETSGLSEAQHIHSLSCCLCFPDCRHTVKGWHFLIYPFKPGVIRHMQLKGQKLFICRTKDPPWAVMSTQKRFHWNKWPSLILINYSYTVSIIWGLHRRGYDAFISLLCVVFPLHCMTLPHNTCPACSGCQPSSICSDKTSLGCLEIQCIQCQHGQLFILMGAAKIMCSARVLGRGKTLNNLKRNNNVWRIFQVKNSIKRTHALPIFERERDILF